MAKPRLLITAIGQLSCCLTMANASEPNATSAAVEPATYVQSAVAAQRVTFAQVPTQVGDRVAQAMDVELQVQTTITQASQPAHQGQTQLTRKQQRFVEVLEVVDGNVRKAHVTFPRSRIISPENPNPQEEIVQPVEQKSYVVTRKGEQLLVTDTEGVLPPQQEFEIVATSLQHLGLPSPLTAFLLGRTVSVGERLEVPREVAQHMMGFSDQLGEVKQFVLELKEVKTIDGRPCAVFAATIEAVGEPANPVRIHAFGQVVIQTETCRTVRASLSGPLTLSTAEHTPAGSFQYAAQGKMRVAIQSQYGHAPK